MIEKINVNSKKQLKDSIEYLKEAFSKAIDPKDIDLPVEFAKTMSEIFDDEKIGNGY